METLFINDYKEPIFEKVPLKNTEKVMPTQDEDLNFKLIKPEYEITNPFKNIKAIKNKFLERLQFPIHKSNLNKVSDKQSCIIKGNEVITKELNKTKTSTIILTFSNKKVVEVITDIDEVFLSKIKSYNGQNI